MLKRYFVKHTSSFTGLKSIGWSKKIIKKKTHFTNDDSYTTYIDVWVKLCHDSCQQATVGWCWSSGCCPPPAVSSCETGQSNKRTDMLTDYPTCRHFLSRPLTPNRADPDPRPPTRDRPRPTREARFSRTRRQIGQGRSGRLEVVRIKRWPRLSKS